MGESLSRHEGSSLYLKMDMEKGNCTNMAEAEERNPTKQEQCQELLRSGSDSIDNVIQTISPTYREDATLKERFGHLEVFKKPQELIRTVNKLEITDSVIQEISMTDVHVVAVCGIYRTGKSYLMNTLANETKNPWRKFKSDGNWDSEYRDMLIKDINRFSGHSTMTTRILLVGKSSFSKSIACIDKDRINAAAESTTTKYADQHIKEKKETKPNREQSMTKRIPLVGTAWTKKSSYKDIIACFDKYRVRAAKESTTAKLMACVPKKSILNDTMGIEELTCDFSVETEYIERVLDAAKRRLSAHAHFIRILIKAPPKNVRKLFEEKEHDLDISAENKTAIAWNNWKTTFGYRSYNIEAARSVTDQNGVSYLQKGAEESKETERKIKDVLEKETPRLEHLVMCKICLDVDASVVFLPCTHMVACGICASYLQQCPLCRAMIDKVLYINLQ